MLVFTKVDQKPPKRRFADISPVSEWWHALHLAADKAYSKFRDVFVSAMSMWRSTTEPLDLFHAIISSDITTAENIISVAWDRQVAPRYTEAMRQLTTETFSQAAEVAKPHVERLIATRYPQTAQIGIQLGGPASPQTQAWAEQYAAQEVRYIGDSSKDAIRRVIRRHFAEGVNPQQMAKEIRQYLGLTERQAAAVERFRQSMTDAKLSPSVIEKRTQSRINRMIRQRATLIARNETHAIASHGNYQALLDAKNQGLLDEERTRRFWVITPGSRTCQHCLPVPGMNPKGVRITEPFATPLGPSMVAHLHVACRCAEGVRFVDSD